MIPLDRGIERAQALLIDGNATSRSILAAQLRDLGVGSIVQASRLADGRRKLESSSFDIVVCEQDFPGETLTGRELLDDLRRAGLLPSGTVFLMVSGEARYEQVAEAAESALDGYLLKPYTATALAERLRQARSRKRSLAEIFAAIGRDELEAAVDLCLARFRQRGEQWLYAARLAAELLLRLGRTEAAADVYRAVLELQPLPWARLGSARAQAEGGQLATARRSLDALVAGEPGYPDGWDLLCRVQLDQGRLDEALASAAKAAALTPGSTPRLQRHGMLAFYLGDDALALKLLERAALSGAGSRLFDDQTLVLLALLRHRGRDGKGLQRCRSDLAQAAERAPDDARRARFAAVAAALDDLLAGRTAAAQAGIAALMAEQASPTLDVEAACNLLALLAEAAACALPVDAAEDCISALATRFATSRGTGEMLRRAVARHAPFGALVDAGQAGVMSLSERALVHALEGAPATAVRQLLDGAESTLNAKLADTAQLTLQRHAAAIAEAPALQARIAALRERYAASWAAPRLGQGQRAAGGLSLRGAGAGAGAGAVRTGSPVPAVAKAA